MHVRMCAYIGIHVALISGWNERATPPKSFGMFINYVLQFANCEFESHAAFRLSITTSFAGHCDNWSKILINYAQKQVEPRLTGH